MEDQDQVVDDAASSDDSGALSDTYTTQDSQASSSDDGATDVQEPTVAELQQQLDEMKASHAERDQRWIEDYRKKESEVNQLQGRLKPYEQQAQMQQEQIDEINTAFHDRAAVVGYPQAIAEQNAQQNQQAAAQMETNRIVNEAREQFIKAGKMPSDFDQFYGNRNWNSVAAFKADVELYLKADSVTKVTEQSKAELARQAEEDARRKAANKQPRGGGSPSVGGKSNDPGQSILDSMAAGKRKMSAAGDEL